MYQLNFEAIMRHLLKPYNLEKKYAKEEGLREPVMWAFMLDGAKITNNLQHLFAGCKIVDKRAMDPLTNTPFLLNSNYESRDSCFSMIMLMSNDKKEVYKVVVIKGAKLNKRRKRIIATINITETKIDRQ